MAVKTWNGSDGAFSSAGSWSPTGAPQPGDTVLITAGMVTVTGPLPGSLAVALTSTAASSPELILSDATLATGSRIDIDANRTNATLRVNGVATNQGKITATGTSPGTAVFRIDDAALGGASTLVNTGSILVTDAALQMVSVGANPGNHLENDGLIAVRAPLAAQRAFVSVDFTGTGTVLVGAGVTFQAVRAVSAGQTIVFERGVASATWLALNGGQTFAAAIDGFAASDTILVTSPRWDAAAYTPGGAGAGVLTLSLNGAVVQSLRFQGSYTLASFGVAQSIAPGTSLSTTTITTTVAEVAGVTGTPGDDQLTDGPGDDLILGGVGRDVLTLAEGRRGATFSVLQNGDVSFSHHGQVDILRSVEEVRFLDGREVFDAADPAASVVRLYQAGLGRAPEQAGMNFWIERLQAGAPLADLATGFLTSPEFIARFGGTLTSNDFVVRIYQNVLGRDPDEAGLIFWRDSLDTNRLTRSETLAGISESPENQDRTAPQVNGGIWDVNETSAQLARLYDTAFGRVPDAGGLDFWTRYMAGGHPLLDPAEGFLASPEFQATYGALDNRHFVDAVYLNILDRPGETTGVDFWTSALDAGTSRAQVLVGFSESLEHQGKTQQDVLSDDPSRFGIRLA